MAQNLQNADLARDPLDVGLLNYFLFLEGLDGHLGVGGNVHA